MMKPKGIQCLPRLGPLVFDLKGEFLGERYLVDLMILEQRKSQSALGTL
jgi:hypothetical protein